MTNIIDDAIEALRPFMMAAEAYTSFDGQHDFPDGYTFDIGAFQRVTVGDLRRAAATLARLEQAKENAQPVAWMYGADREEPHALREALAPFAHAAFEADGYPDSEPFTLALRPDVEDFPDDDPPDPESLITARQLRLARTALAQKEGG